jgi:soluble lytic murein transglycosylase
LAACLALRLSADERLERRMLEVLRRSYEQLPAYRAPFGYRVAPVGREFGQPLAEQTNLALARELIFLGAFDEGAAELAAAERSRPGVGRAAPGANNYTTAVYFNRGERADRAIAFGEPLWKALPRDYHLEVLPRDFAELVYPAPYRQELRQATGERGVDPRFLLALARQESRFQPEVKSLAAARGLMQFIPETARKMAAELQVTDFTPDDLYDPATAVLFGAQYVKNLFRDFPDNPYAVAAAYNSGEDNVKRWRNRAKSEDVDRLVIDIGIRETKDYVHKVMANYWAYQAIYGRDLR